MNKKYVLISTDYSMIINGIEVCADKVYEPDAYKELNFIITIKINGSTIGIPRFLCTFFDTLEQLENYLYLS
jgi:hypothetical protein